MLWNSERTLSIFSLLTIQEKRQLSIDENLRQQKVKRSEWLNGNTPSFKKQEVLIKAVQPNKLETFLRNLLLQSVELLFSPRRPYEIIGLLLLLLLLFFSRLLPRW